MAVNKEFYEAASKDPALKAEAEHAAYDALAALLREKGFEDEAAKAMEAATEKVAKAHGFEPRASAELDLDELGAVAGGACGCVVAGGGGGHGKKCACVAVGTGKNDSGKKCICVPVGAGLDE